MFSLLGCESEFLTLCASMSCDQRRAHAMPAGPPPTMTTSAGIFGRSMPSSGLRKTSIQDSASRFGFLYFLNQRRHDVKQIPDNSHIRDLENRRFMILVDRDNRTRALHSDNVLNGAADSKRKV